MHITQYEIHNNSGNLKYDNYYSHYDSNNIISAVL